MNDIPISRLIESCFSELELIEIENKIDEILSRRKGGDAEDE